MMIKITEKCSMGCSHCMNNALPSGKHMDFGTFKKSIDFVKTYGGPFCILTGGEPTEHPQFKEFFRYMINEMPGRFITVTTNGVWLQDKNDYVTELGKYFPNVMFQVTSVDKYYPTHINTSLPVFNHENVTVCTELPSIYPQGRALNNGLEYNSKGSKCFNIRAIANQVTFKDLRIIISMLAVKEKFCTPHISIDGHIKLGESDLCPNCSHIDKTNSEIMDDIINFRCKNCSIINSHLPFEYLKLIGEE